MAAAEWSKQLLGAEEADKLDKVEANIGRLNWKLGNHTQAIQAFKAIR